ncbi:MAG: HDIG domain-containing protein [Acidimicrobiales bacterium]|jgi:poly(A) polymerase|nr:HDIG domain-containing protein [Acidimicrobiales bacterium]|tara:strand:+ start:2860 stop:3636 length:777 start_codon:yes stop_codon:yes gene_type:complete
MADGSGGADRLSAILIEPDCAPGLWASIGSGEMEILVPELPLLAMEQDPIHRHKDVLAHTIAVVNKTRPENTIRLGALFHDIAKPRTRSFEHGGVTFRHHEVVGARMARKRLEALGYPEQVVDDVSELVRLSGRFKGYSDGWSDSAVRRYARDAGPLLGTLNEMIRCDCTTRSQVKAAAVQSAMDDLELRISVLAEADRLAAERPEMDGAAVMAHLGIAPGRVVGEALAFLLEAKRAEGHLERTELEARLDAWWASRF